MAVSRRNRAVWAFDTGRQLRLGVREPVLYSLEESLIRQWAKVQQQGKVESRMHKNTQISSTPRKAWTAPRLSKLGTIGDVANSLTRSNTQSPVFS